MNYIIIKDTDRVEFLYKKLGTNCLRFEQMMFAQADQNMAEYKGGWWEFCELENGSFFLMPDLRGKQTVTITSNANYFEDDMTAEQIGIAFSLLAFNHLAHADTNIERQNQLVDYFYLLREAIPDDSKYSNIFGYID